MKKEKLIKPSAKRSRNMRRIKSKNTSPEVRIRKLLWKLGYRGWRLHRKDLPGTPDIAFISKKVAIFVHGCFWHGHDCKRGWRIPKTNSEYWTTKIQRNIQRDANYLKELHNLGWRTLIIWECELKHEEFVADKLKNFLS